MKKNEKKFSDQGNKGETKRTTRETENSRCFSPLVEMKMAIWRIELNGDDKRYFDLKGRSMHLGVKFVTNGRIRTNTGAWR